MRYLLLSYYLQSLERTLKEFCLLYEEIETFRAIEIFKILHFKALSRYHIFQLVRRYSILVKVKRHVFFFFSKKIFYPAKQMAILVTVTLVFSSFYKLDYPLLLQLL